jgi:hypothetical protein
MIQPGRGPRLAHEPLPQLRGDQSLLPRHLERHVAAQLRIVGPKDDAEGALAQLVADGKTAQTLER